MPRPFLTLRLLCGLALGLGIGAATWPVAHAGTPSDIDIYSGVAGAGDRPNVLLVLDSSANWSSSIPAPNCRYNNADGTPGNDGPPSSEQGKKVGIEKCALYNVINALPVNADGSGLFNVGLMLFNESGGGSNPSAAYPRIAMQELSQTAKADVLARIRGLDILADKGNNAAFAKSMYESYLYFGNRAPYGGMSTPKYDSRAFQSGRYKSPSAASCGRNYVIFIANGGPGESTNNQARDLLAGLGGSTALIDYPNSVVTNSDEANWADEFARFMRGVDVSDKDGLQGIVTHAVAVVGARSDGLYPNFIRSMANYGGGSYFEANNADVLVSSLLQIFNEIQSVNSVFASASLPVSVTTRGTYLNQVYIGMFRPDASAKPRWVGNLKQYKFKLDTLGTLSLADRNNEDALSSTTGFIRPAAVSYWTEGSSFWANQVPLLGDPPSASDSPDGAIVEKGAAAQRLRSAYAASQGGRNVYTCIGCANGTTLGTPSTEFSDPNTTITAEALGASDEQERRELIEWLRGTDNAGDERGPGGSTTVRPSVHGDVLHSRPAVLNYGGSTGVVVFYGSNDGQLRAINGNQSGVGAGEELWSFVPEEALPKLRRLRDNVPAIRISTTPAGGDNEARGYTVDGPIGVYQELDSAGLPSRVILYVGMRRGGRAMYAIDVSNPAAPKYLWKVHPGVSGMSALGYTWAEARVGRVRGRTNPVVVLGGGYDPVAEDANTPGTTTMGNAVYVLDAFSGALVHTFSTGRSVIADVALMDHDRDGYTDRGYVADLGGKIYRINFEDASGDGDAENWSIYELADLGGGTSTGRKFMHKPDIVKTRAFTAVMLGSGDREKPLLSATQDHFFQIFDRRNAKGSPETDSTPIDFASLAAIGSTPSFSGAGCYLALAQGEKVVNASSSIAGQSYFGTNRPTPPSGNSCSANLGQAKAYAMAQFCGAATSSEIIGGGLPPSPVTGFVTLTGPDGKEVTLPVGIGIPNPDGSPIAGPLAPSRPQYSGSFPLKRLYWFPEKER